jgi:Swt1-like HEPN
MTQHGWLGRSQTRTVVLANRDRVGRALEFLARGLGSFVDRNMAAFLPTGRDWLQVMIERAAPDGRQLKMTRSDARVLLRVIWENPRAFQESLSRLELAYAREITEVANQWAHLEPFSDADTIRALDTMVRMLRAAGAEDEASHVSTLLPGNDGQVLADDDSLAEVDASLASGPTVSKRAGHPDPAVRRTVSAERVRGCGVAEFRDRDADYLCWVGTHRSGYVINIGRSGRGSAVIHHASCGAITSRAPFTDSCMKVCSESLGQLDAWAVRQNGIVAQRCGICHPPASSALGAAAVSQEPTGITGGSDATRLQRNARSEAEAQGRKASKYDALRDFLTKTDAAPITLTFTQVDQLIGNLPRSARLYHLWWGNDDPSHHHCRSWGDAGYIAQADLKGQTVTFIPRPR